MPLSSPHTPIRRCVFLKSPTADEERLLGPWQYSKNHTALHTDQGRMPSSRRAWVSWNYIKSEKDDFSSPISLTYYMNRLQHLDAGRDYFVSLNQKGLMAKERIIYETDYDHPQYDFSSIDTQAGLAGLNGRNNTYFCGSYFGYGFHEDGARSALSVLRTAGSIFMNSKIYIGRVTHHRLLPVKNSFSYPYYFYAFDLDELPLLDKTVRGFRI